MVESTVTALETWRNLHEIPELTRTSGVAVAVDTTWTRLGILTAWRESHVAHGAQASGEISNILYDSWQK